MFFLIYNKRQMPKLKKQLTRWGYTNVWVILFFIQYIIAFSCIIYRMTHLNYTFSFRKILNLIGASQVLKLVKDSIKICGERRTWSVWRKSVLLKGNIGVFHNFNNFHCYEIRNRCNFWRGGKCTLTRYFSTNTNNMNFYSLGILKKEFLIINNKIILLIEKKIWPSADLLLKK
jgi:hypothetical protein